MPSSVSESELFSTTVSGPAGGDPRTAKSVRDMGAPLASRTRWLKGRLESLLGTSQKVESVSAAANTLTLTAHALVNDDPVAVVNIGGSLPSPLLAPVVYYVIKIDNDTIKLTATVSGSAIDLTDAGTGDHYIFKLTTALDSI